MAERRKHKEVITRKKSPYGNTFSVSAEGLCGRENVDYAETDTEVTCLDCLEKLEALLDESH